MTTLSRRAALGIATSLAGALLPSAGFARDSRFLSQGPNLQFEIYKDSRGAFRWRLKAGNGRIVATSSEGYKAKADCRNGIDLIKRGAGTAAVVEVS